MSTSSSTSDLATFGRSFALGPSRWAWLIGAGASAAANIPTGTHMIREFKARLFADALNLPLREIDTGDPLWVERIDAHFATSGTLPAGGDPDEYAAAFEAAYPSEADRRTYIDGKVAGARPSYGHRVLAALVASGQADCMFTTNFDPLVENAVAVARDLTPANASGALTVASIDSAERAARCVAESDWPLLVKLHGDFKESRLKNTTAELQDQDESLRAAVVQCATRFGLIVVGYSGRDHSIMETLHAALQQPGAFPAGIRWVARDPGALLPAVGRFLDAATAAGVDAALLAVSTFDELAGAIERQATLPSELVDHLRSSHPQPRVVPVDFRRPDGQNFPVLRCSALPITELPRSARLVRVDQPLNAQQARSIASEQKVRVTVTARGSEIFAFGADADLRTAFGHLGAVIEGDVPLDPLSDSVHLGLVYDGLLRALTLGRPLQPLLRRKGHLIRVRPPNPDRPHRLQQEDERALASLKQAYGGNLVGKVPNLGWPFAEAARVRLDSFDGQWWCVFEPSTYVERPRPNPDQPVPRRGADIGIETTWRKERWARRYNSAWSAIIDAWAGMLVEDKTEDRFAYPHADGSGSPGKFVLSRSTGWSRPAASGITA